MSEINQPKIADLFCKVCGTTTPHYMNHKRCTVCAKESSRKSKAKLKAAGLLKPREKATKKVKINQTNVAPMRDFNFMKAPIYMGEKWLDPRGQMKPTTFYVGVTG